MLGGDQFDSLPSYGFFQNTFLGERERERERGRERERESKAQSFCDLWYYHKLHFF